MISFRNIGLLFSLCFVLLLSCKDDEATVPNNPNTNMELDSIVCEGLVFDYQMQEGCDGQIYPDPATSPYILPYPVGETYSTGLTNCSESFHAEGQPDQYAYDFDMPEGAIFTAARAGTVSKIVESESSFGGGAGNYLIVNHNDGTHGLYYHSPKDGITVGLGNNVDQGQPLGKVGKSGLAGYAHLHFLVVEGIPLYPYDGIPITFNNVVPETVVLKKYNSYTACGE